MVAESVMLIGREEVAGPDDYQTDPDLQKWAHEAWSLCIGDQKVRVTQPPLRHVVHGDGPLQSYVRLLPRAVLRGVAGENPARGLRAEPYRDRHRLSAGAAWLHKTLLPTNPIESLLSLARHRDRNITRTRGSALLQRWLGALLLDCERPCTCVHGCAGMAQALTATEAEDAEPQSAPTKKAA